MILEVFGIESAFLQETESEEVNDADSVDEKVALHILLAEDNAVNQKIAMRRIAKLGHKVTVVENGYEALEQVAQHSFDCILMDIQMPGMDGYESTRQIRQYEASEQMDRHFMVAMTAHVMKGDEQKCYENDMDAYISKPFRVERLQEVFELALQRKKSCARGLKCNASEQIAMPQSFLAYYASLDPEAREDLLAAAEVMSKSVPQDISKLEEAIREGDVNSVKFMAHTLRGVVGVFAQQDLYALGERLEAGCCELPFNVVERMAREFIVQLEAFVGEVDGVFSSPDR